MKKLLFLPVYLVLCYANLSAQWVSLNGPYGGYVEELLSNEDYVFANKSSGLFRSADAGLHWERCDTAVNNTTVIDQQHLLRKTADSKGFRYSSDNGDHWQEVPLPNQANVAYHFAVKDGIIVFTYGNKIYRSADQGQNWQGLQINGEPFHWYSFLKTTGNRICLGNRSRLLYSDDGLNWNYISAVYGDEDRVFTSLFLKDSLVLAQIENTVWRSVNAGLNWEQAISPPTGGFVGYMTADFVSVNDTLFASTSRKLLRSDDNGLSWDFVNPDGSSYDNLASFDHALFGGGVLFGVEVSTDLGQHFHTSNTDLQGGDVFAVAIKANDLWIWNNQGIVKLEESQINWNTPTLLNPAWGGFPGCRIYPFQEAVFANEHFGPVMRSFNGGQSWDTLSAVPSIEYTENAKIEKKGDTLFLRDAFVRLYQSTDLGDHWDWISPNIIPQIGGSVRDVVVQGSTVFITNWKSIYRSEDNLLSWQLTGDSLPFGQNAAEIRLFATPHFLYAWVDEKQLYLSQNHGESWYPAVLPTLDFGLGIDDKLEFAEIGNHLLALFEGNGVFKSDDSGQNWHYFHEGLPYSIRVTEFTYSDSNFWLGTRDFGLYKRPISDLSPVSTAQPFLDQKKLAFFPNPSQGIFNCTIPAEISGEINLSVFNLQGQQMLRRTVSAEHLEKINLSHCPKGVYWVSLVTAQGAFGGKVVIQ